jgi:hypothetical protein
MRRFAANRRLKTSALLEGFCICDDIDGAVGIDQLTDTIVRIFRRATEINPRSNRERAELFRRWVIFPMGVAEAMMNNATEYRHYADECQRLAQQTQDAPSREGYLALAGYWRQFAIFEMTRS